MKKRALIIGDSCIDVFQYGKCERISPEAPVPILIPTFVVTNKGMSSNVYSNLKALDVECDIITNTDDDVPVKKRFVDEVSNQMLLRVDKDNSIKPLIELDKLYNNQWDIVVISDYNKGFLSENKIKEIVNYCKKNDIITFLDTKKKIGEWAYDVDFIKINMKEYTKNKENLKGFKNHLIVTNGNKGAKYYDRKSYGITVFKLENEFEVRDLSGAGDTFLAGFVADYLKNGDIASAIKFANRCASYVVTQKGVIVVDINKI